MFPFWNSILNPTLYELFITSSTCKPLVEPHSKYTIVLMYPLWSLTINLVLVYSLQSLIVILNLVLLYPLWSLILNKHIYYWYIFNSYFLVLLLCIYKSYISCDVFTFSRKYHWAANGIHCNKTSKLDKSLLEKKNFTIFMFLEKSNFH